MKFKSNSAEQNLVKLLGNLNQFSRVKSGNIISKLIEFDRAKLGKMCYILDDIFKAKAYKEKSSVNARKTCLSDLPITILPQNASVHKDIEKNSLSPKIVKPSESSASLLFIVSN